MRLDRIYTRGGDTGETSLGDGSRVPKFHGRVRVFGGLDEANAAIGVALLHITDTDVQSVLKLIQNDLFDVGPISLNLNASTRRKHRFASRRARSRRSKARSTSLTTRLRR